MILGIMLSGVDFGCLRGTWPIILEVTNWLGSLVYCGLWSLAPPAMALCIFWSPVLLLLDLFGFPSYVFGGGLVCLLFVSFSNPFQNFKTAIWEAWKTKVSCDLSARAGFRVCQLLEFRGSMKRFNFFPPAGRRFRTSSRNSSGWCLEWTSPWSCPRRNRSL